MFQRDIILAIIGKFSTLSRDTKCVKKAIQHSCLYNIRFLTFRIYISSYDLFLSLCTFFFFLRPGSRVMVVLSKLFIETKKQTFSFFWFKLRVVSLQQQGRFFELPLSPKVCKESYLLFLIQHTILRLQNIFHEFNFFSNGN